VSAEAALTLCIQLWSKAGQDDALAAYEDAVLALIPEHGGTVVQRVRRSEPGDGPLEVQIITMPGRVALQSYLDDSRRLALAASRELAVERTLMAEVVIVD